MSSPFKKDGPPVFNLNEDYKKLNLWAQMYSVRELPTTLRETFELPCDPYRDPDYQAMKYLSSLGIIYYRDDRKSAKGHGIIIPVDDVDYSDESGFTAYRYSVWLSKKDLKPSEWKLLDPKSTFGIEAKQRRIKKYGDLNMWIIWGKQVLITEVSSSSVRIA